MTSRSISTIDPGGAARRLGAEGQGIVIAVVGSGIDAKHPHFSKYANLSLPPSVQHYDLTLFPHRDSRDIRRSLLHEEFSSEALISRLPSLDNDLLRDEALTDRSGHTTHVAGIIAGYLEARDAANADADEWGSGVSFMAGVAPRCKLLSLKVIDDEGRGDEFDILRSLDVVMALNARAGAIVVHAVVMPLSLHHDVRNYACGRTPVCTAVDRLVEAGVVVIVASGNRGYVTVDAQSETTALAGLVTITDPGNAELAITVGSTHRSRAKEYGASYFSSRGPTLDGRSKPDLLAPGEMIMSAVPAPAAEKGSRRATKRASKKQASKKPPPAPYEIRDGTSMAAAHVAGAVAVLLSARQDLIGRPHLVKELLLSTATDLGRLAWFQGRGLLNLSRALGDDERADSQPSVGETVAPVAPHAPALIVIPGATENPPARRTASEKRFAVAFTFPGEHREYVMQVASALRELSDLKRADIFYDKYHQSELIRPDLDLYLLDIYSKQSELVVVFLSAEYEKKEWCAGLEWRAVRELIKTRKGHSVMPVRFDDTHVPGLLSIDGFISAKEREPDQIAELILRRLELNRKQGLT